MRNRLYFALLLSCAKGNEQVLFESELRQQMQASGLRDPVPVVSVVGDAYWPSPTPNGRALVYTSAQSGNVDVWKKDFVTGEIVRLTEHTAEDEDPAVSPDGKTVAFISHREDAKGDVFLMDLAGNDERRVTDAKTAERAPAWAPDGKTLFVSSRPHAEAGEDIFRLDLETKKMTRVSANGGFDASADPTGKFVCYSQPVPLGGGHTTSRVVVQRLSDGKVIGVSDGRRPEAFCRFARDVRGADWVYFTRYVEDDNRDGHFDTLDVPAIYRVPFAADLLDKPAVLIDVSEPVTSGFAWETLSAPARDRVFFVGNGPAGLEIQALPFEGLSTKSSSNKEVMALAEADIPARMRRYLLRVVMARPGPEALTARYELSRDFAAEDRLEDSQTSFNRVVELGGTSPVGLLAKLEQARNQFFIEARTRRDLTLAGLQTQVDGIVAGSSSRLVKARARVVLAEAAELLGSYAQSLDFVRDVPADLPEDSARALRIQSAIGSLALPAELEQRQLLKLMRDHPHQSRETWIARQRFLQLLPEAAHERLDRLHDLLPLCRDQLPLYVQLVLNEADTLVAVGQVDLAVKALQGLLDQPVTANDRGRVLYALGKTQELSGALAAALQSFDQLAQGPQFNRSQRTRGRAELLRLALKKAQVDEAQGDLRAAYESYRTLAKNNFQEAFAHRKVLQLGDQLGFTAQLAEEYAAAVKASPYDRTAQYAAALVATYQGDLSKAQKGFQKTIDLDASLGYAHLGLGWVYEQYEYQSPGTSDALEKALYEYSVARSLFETQHDQNAKAEAGLNLGHAFARIGQFDQAFEQYLLRENATTPFQSPAQEVVFRERFGQAAIRAGEPDVALMTLKDGIKTAEREGDERRLGRLKALLALAYDALDMPAEARQALIRARDEYATRNDWDRVVALDRTIGFMWLETGDDREALEALDRSLALIGAGFGLKGSQKGLLTLYSPVDPLDASRAPYGFSRDDEAEILQTLSARVYERIGDGAAAEQYLEERLKRTTSALSASLGKFMLQEYIAANRDIMTLSLRRGDFVRMTNAFLAIGPKYRAAEARRTDWLVGPLRLLQRLPIATLPLALRTQMLAELDAIIGDKSPGTTGDADRLQRTAVRLRERADTLLVEAVAATGDAQAQWAALDRELVRRGREAPSSQPASQATDFALRRRAQRHVSDLLDTAETAYIAADFAGGDAALAEASALAERHALFELPWQAAYLRYRLGSPDQRSKALQEAGAALITADALARVLYPDRARPAIWHDLLRALLKTAAAKKDGDAYAALLERQDGLQHVVLPEGYARGDGGEAERSRQKLKAWAAKTRKIITATERDDAQEKALRAAMAEGAKLIKDAAEPWQSLLLCNVDGKRLRASIGKDATFAWGPLALVGDHFSFGAVVSPTYAVGVGSGAQVASANALWLSALARNIDAAPALEVGPLDEKHKRVAELGAPKDATVLSGDEARTDVLVVQSGDHSVLRLVVDTDVLEGTPGVARFKLTGANTFEKTLSSVQLPGLGIGANLAIVDGLSTLDDDFMEVMSRAFALAATPAVLFCAPQNAEAHGAFLQALYAYKGRTFDAWRAAASAHATAAAKCRYWGYINDDEKSRLAFATAQIEVIAGKAKGASEAKRPGEARALYEMALGYARFLNLKDREQAFLAGIAAASTALEDYDRAIAFQELVLQASTKATDHAEALMLLGQIRSRAKQYDQAAKTLGEAAAAFKANKNESRALQAKQSEGIAWQGAGKYSEAAAAFRVSASGSQATPQRFAALRALGIVYETNLAEFAQAQKAFVEAAGVAAALVTEFQKFQAQFEKNPPKNSTIDETNKKVKMAKDNAAQAEGLRATALIDQARVSRLVGQYDQALAVLRDLLGRMPEKDQLRRSEATLELARVYWFANDYERALNAEEQALHLAEAGRASNDKQSMFLRIQAISLEGLILKDQGKRTAASNRLRQALKLARVTNRRLEESIQLNNLGLVLRERGQLQQSARAIDKAIVIDTDLKAKDGLAVDLRNLGIVRLRQGRLREATDLLSDAVKWNDVAGSRYNGMQIALAHGELALASNNLADAKKAFAAALVDAAALRSRDVEWRARFGMALADAAVALVESERALGVIESLGVQREEVHTLEERVNLLTATQLRQSLALRYAKAGNVAAAWTLLERIRLKELRDQVPSDVWAKRLGVTGDDAADFKKLAEAATRLDERQLVPLFTLQPASLDDAVRVAGHSHLVSLRAFDEGVVVIVAGKGAPQVRFVPVKKTDLLAQAAAWDSTLQTLQPALLAAQPLLALLADILRPALDGAPLVLLCDGFFNRLPWPALPIGKQRLVELAPVRLELSGTHIVAHDVADKKTPLALLSVGPRDVDGLPFARLETEESTALFAEHGKTAKWMTLADFAAAKDRSARFWHIAVHGDSLGKELQGAFLHSGDDVTLYATELLEQRNTVHTAVLSACQKAEEEPNAMALVSALRLSGAERVMAPVTRVYDALAAAFVKKLMSAFAANPQSNPLRALQLEALKAGEPEAAWATFVMVGGE